MFTSQTTKSVSTTQANQVKACLKDWEVLLEKILMNK